jgi:hypothetical protein
VGAPPSGGASCACDLGGSDGRPDLTLEFRGSELAAAIGSSSGAGRVTLTGRLRDGTAFELSDCVTLLGR